jgi:hypothetical protein
MANPIAGVIIGKLLQDADFSNLITPLTDGNSFFPGPTDYKVLQSGTPGMSVVVSIGWGYHYIGSKSAYFQSYLGTATTLSVASNSSGSTRIDIVCVKFDTGVTSNTAGDNVFTLQYVQGTPGAGVPSTPANYTKIAEVSVANGATSIVTGNITDRRQNLVLQSGATQFIGLVNGTPSTPAAGTNKLYFKTDNNLYMLNSSGTETQASIKRLLSSSVLGSPFVTTSNSFVDTGLTANITLAASSNVRISVLGNAQNDTAARQMQFQILRGGSLVRGTAVIPNASGLLFAMDFASLDLAVAAGTYTYKAQMSTDGTHTDTLHLFAGAQLIVEADLI